MRERHEKLLAMKPALLKATLRLSQSRPHSMDSMSAPSDKTLREIHSTDAVRASQTIFNY